MSCNVPAHDTRDFDFAKKFGVEIVEVVRGGENVQEKGSKDTNNGIMVNALALDKIGIPYKIYPFSYQVKI